MKILSVNAGSSSLKFRLYEMPEENLLISGVFERIGIEGSFYTIKYNGEKIKKEVELKNHKDAFNYLVNELLENKVVTSLEEIKGIGHRAVQGGASYNKAVFADDEVISNLTKYISIAPLHNPATITGINAANETLPNAKGVVVFDTAFHQTMPEENFLYAVPYEWYTKYDVRRYGFHGTSHRYVSMRMNEILGRNDTKLITCHIGNGGSISAVLNGKCLNTSMGFTPNAGLVMGSRSGDIDASIIPYMEKMLGKTASEIDTMLNKQSGLLGISGVSSDARDIEDGIKEGNERCVLANKMYVKRVIDYIAKYYVELGGCDAIIFTAGVGENGIQTRKEIIEGLKVLGVTLNEENNNTRGEEIKISGDDSKIDVWVIPTDEELMIAKDTYLLVK
mgnify:FL=1